jgi:hypothetical protein
MFFIQRCRQQTTNKQVLTQQPTNKLKMPKLVMRCYLCGETKPAGDYQYECATKPIVRCSDVEWRYNRYCYECAVELGDKCIERPHIMVSNN